MQASDCALGRGIRIEQSLGFGNDGNVFSTSAATAVKIHVRRSAYDRELTCYRRLRECGVVEVRGFHVPQLIAWSDSHLAIEMSIVQPPFLLDFALAYLDTERIPEFPDEVMEEWHAEKAEQFGERWGEVQMLLARLRGHYGIHLLDVNPRNIMFRNQRSIG